MGHQTKFSIKVMYLQTVCSRVLDRCIQMSSLITKTNLNLLNILTTLLYILFNLKEISYQPMYLLL